MKRGAVVILLSASQLTPLYASLAQENSARSCSLATEISAAGEIMWSENLAAAELVADAKTLNIPASEYHSLCNDDLQVDQVESEAEAKTETTDPELEQADATSSSASTATVSAGGWTASGALAPLGALGLAAAAGGGGGSSSSSSSTSTFLDESTSYTYDAALDATWTARQEYKNSIYGAGTFTGNASTINPYTLVGINNAYARGLSGTGKLVAVYDTDYHSGTHKEFTAKSAASKITNDGTLTVGSDGTSWHGIHVAGTIAADYNSNNSNFTGGSFGDNRDYGMMGVAYNASLHLSDFADTSVYTNSQDRLNAAIQSANTKGAIAQNNSWGWGTCQTGSGCTTIDELVTYQNNNSTSDSASMSGVLGGTASKWADMISYYDTFQSTGVVVFASGNDYNSSNASLQPGLPVVATELAEAWLTVGNLNITGNTISSATMVRIGNACGAAAEFCIFADGTDIWSSTGDANSSTNDEYSTYTGSSMAAPIVSGAVALLSEAFPNHTPEQLVDRILASANNDFYTATGTTSFINGITHGYNSEFGHGLLDLATALGPISASSLIPPSNNTSVLNTRFGEISTARRFALSSSQVQLGVAFGDSLHNSLNGRKAYFYDALNGGFAFDMGSLVKNRSRVSNQRHSFDKFLGGSTIVHRKADNGLRFMSDNAKGDSLKESMMAFVPLSATSSSFIGKEIHMQNALSFTQRGENSTYGVSSSNPFNIPFIQASEQGTSVGSRISLGEGTVSLGMFEGESVDYELKTTGFVAEYGHEMGSTHTSLFIGSTNEDGGFLETSVEGAFAEESSASTNFAGVASYGWLNNNWSYNALGSVGLTVMNVNGVGLLNDIKNVTSASFAFEIARPIGLNERDSIHVGIAQPLRVERGDANIMIPQLYETGGNLNFSEAKVDLSPSGRQVDVSLGYQAIIFDAFNIGLQFAVSQDYGHVKSDELVNSTFVFTRVKF